MIAFGAAVGGPLDWEHGIVSPLHQPGWWDVPLREIIAQEFGRPLVLDVDTNVAALAEYTLAPMKVSRLLYITLSTGMGGGYIEDGQIYRGHAGGHPEVGHQAVPFRCRYPKRVACACGAPDCLKP